MTTYWQYGMTTYCGLTGFQENLPDSYLTLTSNYTQKST